MIKLENNYIIAGASSDLGRTLSAMIAERAGENCRLMMLSRSHCPDLEKLSGPHVKYFSGIDLTNLVSGDHIATACLDFFNGPFSIVHCAGDFWTHVAFTEFETGSAKKMMESHYLTLYATLQCLIPVMQQKKGGKVLAFSFNTVNENFPYILPYNAAKAAVEATIKCIAHEYAQDNITANVMALASFKTAASRKSRPFGDFDNYLELNDISETVLDLLNLSNHLVNASVINCYQYSESYYNQGYFQRIRKT
jgi:NAD(P)-dependent dehydrogenase (short-subunit alcohol dehydrogenase family)